MDVVQRVSHISRAIRSDVKAYLMRRVNFALRRWVKDPVSFRRVLGVSRSVVGGSVVLDIVLNDTWHPKDLDIYCPRDQFAMMVTYLCLDEGYLLLSDTVYYTKHEHPKARTKIDVLEGIASVRKFRKRLSDGTILRIDLIESKDAYAISPIIQAASTLAVNWITTDTVSIGYPLITLKRTAVWRDWSIARSKKWEKVLRKRRFRLLEWPDWRKIRSKVGHHGATCPAILRFSDDLRCLTMKFMPRELVPETSKHTLLPVYPRRVWAMNGIGSVACCHLRKCANYHAQTPFALAIMYRKHYLKGLGRVGGMLG